MLERVVAIHGLPRSIVCDNGPDFAGRALDVWAHVLEREVGFALVDVGNKATADDVVFAEPTDTVILGARSLEGINLRVDPRGKRLVSGGPIIMGTAGLGLNDRAPHVGSMTGLGGRAELMMRAPLRSSSKRTSDVVEW